MHRLASASLCLTTCLSVGCSEVITHDQPDSRRPLAVAICAYLATIHGYQYVAPIAVMPTQVNSGDLGRCNTAFACFVAPRHPSQGVSSKPSIAVGLVASSENYVMTERACVHTRHMVAGGVYVIRWRCHFPRTTVSRPASGLFFDVAGLEQEESPQSIAIRAELAILDTLDCGGTAPCIEKLVCSSQVTVPIGADSD